jgi:seryl-tRNA synthetase
MGFMLDIKLIRENPELVKEAARNKNVEVDIDRLLVLDGEVLILKQELDEKRRQRNEHASMLKGGPTSDENISKGKSLKEGASVD